MCSVAPLAEFSTFTGRSLNQNSIPNSFSRSRSRSEISVSRNGSNLSRPSTKVTFTPNAMKIEAYSHPITPPPITASDFGIRSIRKNVSESNVCTSSKEISDGRCGFDPVAIKIISPRNFRVLMAF